MSLGAVFSLLAEEGHMDSRFIMGMSDPYNWREKAAILFEIIIEWLNRRLPDDLRCIVVDYIDRATLPESWPGNKRLMQKPGHVPYFILDPDYNRRKIRDMFERGGSIYSRRYEDERKKWVKPRRK
jgi:hypothetical protein